MHTQIPGATRPRRARSKVSFLIPAAIVLATASLVAWNAWPLLRPAKEVRVTQAIFDRTALTEPSDAESQEAQERGTPRSGQTVQAPGWLEAEPFFVACAALADGVVETIDVLEGDYVEQNQIVATLVADDAELRLRRATQEVRTAQADLALAEAELAAAQKVWDEPFELNRAVESARAALTESEAELEQLPSLIKSARATLARLNEELKRAEESLAQGASTDLQVVVARQRATAQEADVAALEAREPVLEARIDRLVAELYAAERDLELRIEDRRRLAAAAASRDRANAMVSRMTAIRDEAQLEHDRMIIRAPISGYVQRRLKVPGDKVMRGMDSPHSAHLLHLYDPARIQVRVDVPLADAANVYEGQQCEIIVEVLPDTTFTGEVLRVTHEADLQKNTLQVKVRVDDPSPLLRPEMLTRVKFLAGKNNAKGGSSSTIPATRFLAPTDAIDESGTGTRVWTVTKRRGDRGVLIPVDVRKISADSDWTTLEGDLQPGAILAIVEGSMREGDWVVISSETEGDAP